MQSSKIKVSVVIATYNRAQSLLETLQALQRQDFPQSMFEIIVINDGSTDNTITAINNIAENARVRIHHFSQPNSGPSAARNRGINKAIGEIIAFTDDDCIPKSDWVFSIYKTFTENNDWVGLQGSTYTDVKNITPLTHQIHNVTGNKSVPTCNAAYLKKVLTEVGGFDEEFPFPHNEDADLAWRVEQLGTIGFVKEVVVYHPPRKDHFTKVSKRMKIMESEFRLFHKNPLSYKKNRCSSAWKNIYWEIGVKTQLYYFVTRLKYYRKPIVMLQGFSLTILWWTDLIKLLPRFVESNRINRKMFG